jgi:hypothetical protein
MGRADASGRFFTEQVWIWISRDLERPRGPQRLQVSKYAISSPEAVANRVISRSGDRIRGGFTIGTRSGGIVEQ